MTFPGALAGTLTEVGEEVRLGAAVQGLMGVALAGAW